jgi:hypothetical protein
MSDRIQEVRAAPVENGADAPARRPSGKATPRPAATGGE